MGKTFVHIPVDGPAVTVEAEADVLTQLQRLVDGYIEGVSLRNRHLLMVNENGWAEGKQPNLTASKLYGHIIVGDAVLVGPTDQEGDSTSVHPRMIASLVKES